MSFVQEEVEGLIRKGVVSQVIHVPKVVNPLTVAYNRKGNQFYIKGKGRCMIACLVLNPITVYSYGFLVNCTTVGQASDSMTALTSSFNRWVGA